MNKKTFIAFLLFIFVFNMFMLASCGDKQPAENLGDSAELAKLPTEYPLNSAPLYKISELVSISDKNSENYISYDLTFNSEADYEELVDYYTQFYKDPIIKDFGIAISLIYVPDEKGYMCNFSIFANRTKGEKGNCTVTMSVSTY